MIKNISSFGEMWGENICIQKQLTTLEKVNNASNCLVLGHVDKIVEKNLMKRIKKRKQRK